MSSPGQCLGVSRLLHTSATTDVYSDIGHWLAAAKVVPASGVPGASAGSGAAQGMIGSIKAICHDVGAAVHWAQADVAALPAGPGYSTFCMRNTDFFGGVENALVRTQQPNNTPKPTVSP